MIIVDTALKARAEAGHPVRVGMFGAGFIGRGLANQIINYLPGMQLVAICNRTVEAARQTFAQAGVKDIRVVKSVGELEDAIARGQYTVTDDPLVLCQSESIEALMEVTGHVEYGAQVTMAAIAHGKPMVWMNAELDGTVGPILKVYADRAGVMLTGCDGDQRDN